jgi:tRNA-specific 2-thiouridylase
LYRAHDAERDQSYFLFATTRAQLASLLFPLGAMPKRDVRKVALELGLPVAEKADSQDICFVPQGRYASVIERLKPGAAEAGNIVHVDGRVLGRHEGIIHYTIGQRRGIGVAGGSPLYVVRLDSGRRQVVVGPREALRARWITLKNLNWLGNEPLTSEGMGIAVRIRSSALPQPATIFADRGSARVLLANGEYGVAAGQACVFYADTSPRARVLGGGWIEHAMGERESGGQDSFGAERRLGPARVSQC